MSRPKTPLLTVDCVIFDDRNRVLLIRRRNPPFRGGYALPGGFVDIGETTEAACRREVLEETGVRAARLRLIGVYSDPKRDPRGHTCTAAYLAGSWRGAPKATDDAAGLEWVAGWRRAPLAFDHRRIIADAARLRAAQAKAHPG